MDILKKLKILLPLFLISLFFIPNVYARTTETFAKIESTQWIKQVKENYHDELALITSYINSNV